MTPIRRAGISIAATLALVAATAPAGAGAGAVAAARGGGRPVVAAKPLATKRPSPPAKPVRAMAAVHTPFGFRLGPADAKRVLVEYASPNCGHCAALAEAADPMLRDRAAGGKLAFEWRPHLLFPADPAVAMAARCVTAGRAIDFLEAYYRDLPAFAARLKAREADGAWVDRVNALDDSGFAREVARALDLASLTARFGASAATLEACLADPATGAWLASAQAQSLRDGVSSTPTLFLDGRKVQPGTVGELAAWIDGAAVPAPTTHDGHGHAH